MTVDAAAVLTAIGMGVGVIVWLIRLEAKVKAVDQQRAADAKACERQREADIASLRQQRDADSVLNGERFERIRESLDAINVKLGVLDQMKGKVDQIRSFMGSGPYQGT